MKMWTAYACAWIVTGLAVIVGLYFTKNANCLWALFIPALISIKSKDKDEDGGNYE